MTKRRVLVTGATGYIASILLPALRERYDLRLIDVKNEDRDGRRVEGVETIDILDDPAGRLADLCADVSTIVHCGFRHPGDPATYAGERVNLDMTARIYEVAAASDVERVICTSTNQASKWYEGPYKQRIIDRVDPFDYPRPDTFYGWAKVAYESLGFLYACGSISRPVPNVQVRIVCPRPIKAADFIDRPLVDYLATLPATSATGTCSSCTSVRSRRSPSTTTTALRSRSSTGSATTREHSGASTTPDA